MSAGTHYAECRDCDAILADKDAVSAHAKETMTPTGQPGVTARSHGWRVVTPTPEEVTQRRISNLVGNAIEDAMIEAIDDLRRSVDRGDITEDEVREGLRHYPDFRDAWDEGQE